MNTDIRITHLKCIISKHTSHYTFPLNLPSETLLAPPIRFRNAKRQTCAQILGNHLDDPRSIPSYTPFHLIQQSNLTLDTKNLIETLILAVTPALSFSASLKTSSLKVLVVYSLRI